MDSEELVGFGSDHSDPQRNWRDLIDLKGGGLGHFRAELGAKFGHVVSEYGGLMAGTGNGDVAKS